MSQPENSPLTNSSNDVKFGPDAPAQRELDWDRAIRTALRDAPIPAGQPERLLAIFDEEISTDASRVKVGQVVPPAAKHKLETKRRLGSWRSMAAVAASLLFICSSTWYWYQHPRTAAKTICREMISLAANIMEGNWRSIDSSPSQAYPSYYFGNNLRAGRWQAVPCTLDEQAVVYDYGRTEDGSLLLFVCQNANQTSLSTEVPLKATYYAGRYAGAWRQSQWVYVLLVEGSEDSYRKVVGRSPKIASLSPHRTADMSTRLARHERTQYDLVAFHGNDSIR